MAQLYKGQSTVISVRRSGVPGTCRIGANPVNPCQNVIQDTPVMVVIRL